MKPYKYTDCYRDRHGRVRWYYRRHGRQRPIPFEPGTAEFQRAYDTLNGWSEAAITASDRLENAHSGTWRWLCCRYFTSMEFGELDAGTQRVRRRMLELTCQEVWEPGSARTFGDAPIAAMTPQAISVLRDRKKGLPEAQRGRLKAISRVFDWAIRPENKIAGITSNPAKVVQRPRRLGRRLPFVDARRGRAIRKASRGRQQGALSARLVSLYRSAQVRRGAVWPPARQSRISYVHAAQEPQSQSGEARVASATGAAVDHRREPVRRSDVHGDRIW